MWGYSHENRQSQAYYKWFYPRRICFILWFLHDLYLTVVWIRLPTARDHLHTSQDPFHWEFSALHNIHPRHMLFPSRWGQTAQSDESQIADSQWVPLNRQGGLWREPWNDIKLQKVLYIHYKNIITLYIHCALWFTEIVLPAWAKMKMLTFRDAYWLSLD